MREPPEHWCCPECGPHVSVDVDGCCATCGEDCESEPCPDFECCPTALRAEVARLRAALEGVSLHLTYEAQIPDGGDDHNGCESTSPMWFCLICGGDNEADEDDVGEAAIKHEADCLVLVVRAALNYGRTTGEEEA